MNTITRNTIQNILNSVLSLESQLFQFRSLTEPLLLLNTFPDDALSIFNNSSISFQLDDTLSSIQSLNEAISPFTKRLQSFTKCKKKSDSMEPYAPFKVDEPPVIRTDTFDQLSAEDIIKANGVKPVNHRDEFSFNGFCPFCGADRNYIYSNNHRRQYLCKVCSHTFTDKITPASKAGYYCPHCNHKLSIHHDRKGFIVYVCMNKKCSYYKDKKKRKDQNANDPDLITVSKTFRYRYHYRKFKFDMQEIRNLCQYKNTKIDLSRIHVDELTLGLILTYCINYGISARKTSNLMKDIHGITISHQTILNYISSVSDIIKSMVDSYPYKLSNTQCGDETYVRVKGKNQYVFFFSDPIKKFITSYQIFDKRDTKNAVQSMWNVLKKYHDGIPKDMEFITDANPIYNASQVFFQINGIDFNLHQVVGVKNSDDVSKHYRPYKQAEERLNRTFKQNYYPMNGFGSLEKANKYMVLYTAFFNFLRRHSSLQYKPPVELDELKDMEFMQDKWLKLIEIASHYNDSSSEEAQA